MSNLIEYVISMKDIASKEVVAISSSVVEMGENINKDKKQSEDLSASVNKLEGRLRDVNDVRFGTTLVSQFKDANNEAKALERQVESLNDQMNQRFHLAFQCLCFIIRILKGIGTPSGISE